MMYNLYVDKEDEKMWQKLKEYQVANNIKNRNRAIIELIKKGLK